MSTSASERFSVRRTWRIAPWMVVAILAAFSLVLANVGPLPSIYGAPNQAGDESSRGAEQEVIVKREGIHLLNSEGFRVPLSLSPVRAVELVAPCDGIVRVVSVKPGDRIRDKTEAIRLDDARQQLVIKKAVAELKAANKQKAFDQAKGEPQLVALADARVEAAQAELDLANFDAAALVVKVPFEGEIERVHVVEGEFVRAGQSLARVIDPAKLRVEAPIDRSVAAVGGQVELMVEGVPVQTKVESIVALDARFDAVREIIPSPALGYLTIENAAGKLKAGQTVTTPFLPHDPVCAIPAQAVTNLPDGRRKVQILRDNVVRNLSVQVHGRAGGDQFYVSGRFGNTDEVIVATTRELADGTPLRALIAAGSNKTAKSTGGDKKKKPAATTSGF